MRAMRVLHARLLVILASTRAPVVRVRLAERADAAHLVIGWPRAWRHGRHVVEQDRPAGTDVGTVGFAPNGLIREEPDGWFAPRGIFLGVKTCCAKN